MKPDSLKNTTRGGQTLLHNLRMINQVLNKVLLWTLPVGFLMVFAWFLLSTTPYSRYIGTQWAWAKFYLLVDNRHHQQKFMMTNGKVDKVYSTQVISAPFVSDALDDLTDSAIHSFWFGLMGYLLTVAGVIVWLQRRGNIQSKPKHLRGDYLGSVEDAKRLMRCKGALSDLMMGKQRLPLPLYSEMQHFLFHGSTGSGKSTGIRDLLYQIRSRGDRVLLYDKSCNFVEEFYEPSTDKILNPFDERTVGWSLWKECRDKAEFENYAVAQIPMPLSTQDPFWVNAARTIFAETAYQMRNEKNPRILTLLRHILTADLDVLKTLLKDTVAESLTSDKIEKTAISIKSVLATYLKSLTFIKEDDNPFSIREWIHNDAGHDWLFFSSMDNKHESVRPLITAWFDIAINELLSLKRNDSRRIWLILDEVTTLHKLPSLRPGLAEARKFGGCFVLGLLSHAEMAEVYGERGMQAISSLLNTRFMFREPDPDVATWSSRNLGESIIEEVREGISYGANTMRDGISVNRVETRKVVVTQSEIMQLDNLSSYVRLPGHYPISLLQFDYVKPLPKNVPILLRQFEQDNLRDEVQAIAEQIENKAKILHTAQTDETDEIAVRATTKNASPKSSTATENIIKTKNPKTKKQVSQEVIQESTQTSLDDFLT